MRDLAAITRVFFSADRVSAVRRNGVLAVKAVERDEKDTSVEQKPGIGPIQKPTEEGEADRHRMC